MRGMLMHIRGARSIIATQFGWDNKSLLITA